MSSKAVENGRDQFEKEREKFLSELPESVKKMFGEIGFAPSQTFPDSDDEADEDQVAVDNGESSNEVMLPVLILSPFALPPNPYRDVYWMEKFTKCKRTKTLSDLSHIVYHYGCNDMNDCYNFIEQDEFVDYKTGVSQGFHELPESLQTKRENGTELSQSELLHMRALQEMNEDLMVSPHERRRGQMDFLEKYEVEAGTSKNQASSLTQVSATGAKKRKMDESSPKTKKENKAGRR
jgi:hypothetical protein